MEAVANKKLGVKKALSSTPDKQHQLMLSLLRSIGKVISDYFVAKKAKVESTRQASIQQAARKRNFENLSQKAGKKRKRRQRRRPLTDDDVDEEEEKTALMAEGEEGDESADEISKKQKRRHRGVQKSQKRK
jgi:RNA-splicing ligase RtcB